MIHRTHFSLFAKNDEITSKKEFIEHIFATLLIHESAVSKLNEDHACLEKMLL